ncbi:hypothetical protein BYT27DRAFT_7230171 [Phlegmacium glaucopus]|nr:hypothetical protein BYT27DRAFT_7230171 [Phlegmacium glaucopus]
MANLARLAKSANAWTSNDLVSYNIRVSSQSPNKFYGQPLPTVASLSNLDPNLLSSTLDTQGLSDETDRLLQYLYMASRENPGQDSSVTDFVREILRMFGYEKRDLLLRTPQIDLCLVQRSSTILLVVQEDKTTPSPEPHLIAKAIATFQYNNRVRVRLGRPKLDSMTIPCITMIGTRPIFYLVPVTRKLSRAVAKGHYTAIPTVVKRCVVVSDSRRLGEGMENPNFRQVALQHFAAFCTLAEAHWSALMIPAVETKA